MIQTKEQARTWRAALDRLLPTIKDNTADVNDAIPLIRPWIAGSMDNPVAYGVDDLRVENGIPYKCAQAHTHNGEPGWNPSAAPDLWFEYHGTSAKTARVWRQPTGAHDQYLTNEYMIFNNTVYRATMNTVYSPAEYAQAWEAVE